MKRIFSVILVAISMPSVANYSCSGDIVHLGFDTALHVNNGYGVHTLCQLTDERCNAWTSAVMAAKMSGSKITIYYSNATVSGDQESGQCLNIGNWVTPTDTVYYIEIN